MADRHIYVAVPNHSGSIKGETSDSLLTAQAESFSEGWKFTQQRLTGGYHHMTRNTFLALFKEGMTKHGYTDLVWWDDDVCLAPGQFVPFVKHDVDFVCAPYRHKREIESYPGEWPDVGERKMRESASTKTPLFNAKYWVIGLSRQTASCVDKILADPTIRWIDEDFLLSEGGKMPFVFQDEWLGDGTLEKPWKCFTEDYVYCRKWIDLGGEVWVDPMMQTGHVGGKVFWGQLAAEMERQVREHRIAQQLEAA